MDYILMVTTLFVNAGLGWYKGVWWIWCLHGINAILWIGYSYQTNQMGFVWLSVVTLLLDVFSAWRSYRNKALTLDK